MLTGDMRLERLKMEYESFAQDVGCCHEFYRHRSRGNS